MSAHTIQIATNLRWNYAQDPASGYWIAECPSLKLTVQGETLSEMHASAQEAMQLLFLDLFEDGELDAFLEARGWRTQPALAREYDEDIEFDVEYSAARQPTLAIA